MAVASLGRLESVDPRDVWKHEAVDFTPWLAQEENLALLADTIGLDLALVSTEQHVGPYRADIVCKDTVTGHIVLVENQLEWTDHSHLGQILTYAAGINAVTVVWIARRFTEEHRAALDWLNNSTVGDINFFGLEVEVWCIGDSVPAPKFNIVSKPNDWSKETRGRTPGTDGELTEARQLQLEFWTKFRELLIDRNGVIKPRKGQPQYWQGFAIGRADFGLQAFIHAQKQYVGVSLVMYEPNRLAHFHLLHDQKSDIEKEIGGTFEWDELRDKKSSYVSLYWTGTDPTDSNNWAKQQQCMAEKLEAFHRTFSKRFQLLNAVDYQPDEV